MQKAIILYASQSKGVRQYAERLSQQTGLEVCNTDELPTDRWEGCVFLVLGTPMSSGHLDIASWLLRHWPRLAAVHLLMFTVSRTYAHPERRWDIVKKCLPVRNVDRIETYHLAHPAQAGMQNPRRDRSWLGLALLGLGIRRAGAAAPETAPQTETTAKEKAQSEARFGQLVQRVEQLLAQQGAFS
jgi:hypothetical protein